MLTRAQPVASARSSDSSSRMPPDSSTLSRSVRGDLGDDLGVVATAERGVEVDQVHPLGPGVLPALGRGPRVAEPLLRAGPALDELDGLAAGDIDCGQQHQAISAGQNAPDDLTGSPRPSAASTVLSHLGGDCAPARSVSSCSAVRIQLE